MIPEAESPGDIERLMPDVDPGCLPSVEQYNFWRLHVLWDEGCDPDGTFRGYCRVHEHDGEDVACGMYRFRKGGFKCEGQIVIDGEVLDWNDKRRRMSLDRAVYAIAARYLAEEYGA